MLDTFHFLHPDILWALLLGPILLLWVLWQQKNKWYQAFAFSQLSTLRRLQRTPRLIWIERLIPLSFIGFYVLGILGLAQPQVLTWVPSQNSYLMMVFDISYSMEAEDIHPNRLTAAKATAIEFIKSLPDSTYAGLTFFAGNSYLIEPPTQTHERLIESLNQITLQDLRPGTAMGDAMVMSRQALLRVIKDHRRDSALKSEQPQKIRSTMVILTDGETNLGESPLVAAQTMPYHQIRVYPVGIGNTGGGFIRQGIYTQLDESTLKRIAQVTSGQYFSARSIADFKAIYRTIAQKAFSYKKTPVSLVPGCLVLLLVWSLLSLWVGVHYRRF